MSDRATVSVCMATYNGSRFLREQIASILDQLSTLDEIVIVDDASSDDSVAILEGFDDPRITVHRNDLNLGYVRSFERALGLANGEILLLADQDDIWVDDRIDSLVDAASRTAVVASNLILLDSGLPLRSPLTGRPWLLRASTSGQRVRNQLRILAGDAPYFGCTMALRRDALGLVLPFPSFLAESHDLWIATAANAARELTHVEAPTVRRRVHGENASSERPRGIAAALRSRILLIRLWREALNRTKTFARRR